MNQLSILVGQPPGTLDAMLDTPAPLPPLPPLIGIGVPSTLARRWPDVREAEVQLHAATANVGVAVASFYPDISLTGNLGIRAIDANYLTNWASHFFSAGPSLSLPIFQGGKLTADLNMARAQEAAATLNYRATVLNALREVENALVAYRTDRAARDKLIDEVKASEQAVYLARDSYSHGLTNFLQVLDAQRTAISARQQLIQANISLINDVVALYNALAGGWQERETPIPPPLIDTSLPPVPGAFDSVATSTE
jgi:NodT family efflux transporter outer membrane factor (OMF) lipoprotein